MIAPSQPTASQPQRPGTNYVLPFILVTSLFFFWGFIHNLDPVLIPHLRRAFSLTTVQASLVDTAVFAAYFLMAIPAGIILKKLGYKNGILVGLLLFAIGCFLFVPAANTMYYAFFLSALFVVACGLTILETAANPYATVLGPPETATFRLNLAQSFNGLAAFLAPIAGGKLILAEKPLSEAEINTLSATAKQAWLQSETATVKLPYIILGCLILGVAVLFYFSKLPEITDAADDGQQSSFGKVLQRSHVRWAVAAQFFYIGAQVCVLSFLILFATRVANITETEATFYSGAAGLSFMIGRFVGTFLMKYIAPPRLLTIYAACCMALSVVAITAPGVASLYAVIGIAFFMSVMFPTIFALGIADLGAGTKPASSLLVMSIVGGAIIPPLFGLLDDKTGNIQYSYIVVLICFAVVFLFGLKGHRVSKKDVETVPFSFD